MMLKELTQIAQTVLPIEAFKEHLRLGSGFADDDAQDALLERCLRAAIASVEARTDKALITRTYVYELSAWRDFAAQALPLAPVIQILKFELRDHEGTTQTVAASKYMLEDDTHRPRLVSMGVLLPQIPVGGRAMIEFSAGYAAEWEGLPSDLAQAVLILAAHYYEQRYATAVGTALLPYGVGSLIERYRPLRLFGGQR